MANQNQERLIFVPKLGWRLLPLLCLSIYIPIYIRFCLTFLEGQLELLAFIAVTILLGYLGFWVYLFSWKTRLIIDSAGLHVEGMYSGTLQWQDALAIDSQTYSRIGLPRIHTWGITYYAEAKRSRDQRKFLPLGHIIERPPHKKVEMLVVLTGIDWEKFKTTELGQAFYHYAPQLFPDN